MGLAVARAVADGFMTGGVYALMAAGLTLLFGVMEVINVAQGILVILSAYLSYTLEVHFHIGLFLGLLVTIPVLFGLGACIDLIFLRRVTGRERIVGSLLVTYAVALVIEGILNIIFSANYVQLHAPYVTQTVDIGGVYIAYIYIYGFLLAVGVLACLYLILYRTKVGAGIRATMQDRLAASIVGVNVKRVSTIAFGIGVGMTAAGGMVFGAQRAFSPNTSEDLISRLLVIIVLGGLGSIGGALVSAVFMVVVEDVISVVWSPDWATLFFMALMVAVLSVRPHGLFGQRELRTE